MCVSREMLEQMVKMETLESPDLLESQETGGIQAPKGPMVTRGHLETRDLQGWREMLEIREHVALLG